MLKMLKHTGTVAIGTAALMAAALAPGVTAQQRPDRERQQQFERPQRQDWDWDGNYRRLLRINAGTFITVRTTQPIQSNRDGRVFNAVVAEDVWDDYGRLSVAAIPQGSRVELIVRSARDGDLVLDLQSIFANGQRYDVNAQPQRVETDGRRRDAGDTAEWVGGGAVLGSIIGAIAGGGKGAAIGAGAGAATGLGLAYQGRTIRIPAGSRLTFRLNHELEMRAARVPRSTQNRDWRDRQ